jgi:hypothetical protein
MNDEELKDLRELGQEVAGAMQSPWEPACVAKAFASQDSRFSIAGNSRLVLTMQVWMDLSAIHSPILLGELPGTGEELEGAAEAFGASAQDLSPAEAMDLACAMRRCVGEAFAMQLPMKRPGAVDDGQEGGFGEWLPIYACLVTEIGIPRGEARAMDVREVFALIAAMRWNQGWSVAGEPYALRESGVEKQEHEKGED